MIGLTSKKTIDEKKGYPQAKKWPVVSTGQQKSVIQRE
ncbi:hypothetical protein KUC_1232 [Vreelandella boliviensis LC1]|uniref:Uncharacterized protein n=1 Tax=Vreelandella boliviensis LC1 TaxID=1072583 RepID=A0A7U9GHC5_9GAMM|nr:hypothetical protein KUC_1232 [Halomonas boliviensis LC1]